MKIGGGGDGEKEAKLLLLDLIANHLAICCQIIMYHLYDAVLVRCARIMQTPCLSTLVECFKNNTCNISMTCTCYEFLTVIQAIFSLENIPSTSKTVQIGLM